MKRDNIGLFIALLAVFGFIIAAAFISLIVLQPI